MRNPALPALIFTLAVSARAGEKEPEITHVGMVAPDIIGVTIQAQRAEYGRQTPYSKQPGDKIEDAEHHRWVRRNGKIIGSLVGREGRILYTVDRAVGERLDTRWADQPASYVIQSRDDPDYRQGVAPAAVFRKSKPSDFAREDKWRFGVPCIHVLYLKMPRPLKEGRRYRLGFEGGPLRGLRDRAFVYDPERLRSETVHISHVGFRPDDPAKVAFLSCWMGSGGPLKYKERLEFEVVDERTGRAVHKGRAMLSKAADDKTEDAYKRNYNGTDVYMMDFSTLSEPGTYRVSVEGVGCSYAFEIADDAWRKAFYVSARGLYHQRSGVELGPPYTDFKRPRCFHPDDGVKVFASKAALMDTGNGLNRQDSNFGNLVKGKTDEVVPDAWGGYMDAGDWDRRIQHLRCSRLLLELAGAFPDYFDGLSLNIPESRDGLPDVVSEALFNLDCYRRMQTKDGGIRGGIESERHPRHGEGSWQESLDIMAYAPGIWSSYEYAGVAARAAFLLQSRKPRLARTYRDSALRAMEWAEKEFAETPDRKYPHPINDSRNLAAAELFRLTGDGRRHKVFLSTNMVKGPEPLLYKWKSHEQGDAAWVYLNTFHREVDAGVKQDCLNALRREADERIEWCGKTGFRWTKDPWRPAAWGALSTPDAIGLVRAHKLTGETRYLRAAVLACQTGAGANPLNMCYTTGLGHRNPQHPLHIDSRITHQPPPPGITVYGPQDLEKFKDYWGLKLVTKYCHPPAAQWPSVEAYWDVFWYPAICEFTVHQTMAVNAYVWGYLAARPPASRRHQTVGKP